MDFVTVLLVDDHAVVRQGLRAYLDLVDGISVVGEARDGQEAIEMARKVQPTVAVVDVNMPRLNGFAALREMVKVSPHTGFMIITGNPDPMVRREAERHGVREVLFKPFTPAEFMAAIRRVAAAQPPRTLAQDVLTFLKIGRMDDEAARVYAEYIQHPQAEPDTLARLAEIFCARRDWTELRRICERMEQFKT